MCLSWLPDAMTSPSGLNRMLNTCGNRGGWEAAACIMHMLCGSTVWAPVPVALQALLLSSSSSSSFGMAHRGMQNGSSTVVRCITGHRVAGRQMAQLQQPRHGCSIAATACSSTAASVDWAAKQQHEDDRQ